MAPTKDIHVFLPGKGEQESQRRYDDGSGCKVAIVGSEDGGTLCDQPRIARTSQGSLEQSSSDDPQGNRDLSPQTTKNKVLPET